MKKIFITLALIFLGYQFSVAQQIINTNTKSTCTYNGSDVVGCADESITATFTFKENQQQVIRTIAGVDYLYTVVSRTFTNPGWTYRISDSEGNLFDLKLNQREKQFDFYPAVLTDGSSVIKYRFN